MTFRVGDVVEASVSFMAVPNKGKFKIVVLLKGLILLDQTARDVSSIHLTDLLHLTIEWYRPQQY